VSDGPPLGTIYVRWTWCRAILHRGWWLVTSVYLVVDARLSASQLVLIGVAQGAVALLFEVPAGAAADTVSRKWSLVVSQVLMGTAMMATGLVTGFGALVATQMLWGLSWTLASGADVAWISDELRTPALVSSVLIRAGRAQLTGAVAGMVGLGGLAWLMNRGTVMVLAGAAMLLLGLYVVVAFREERFVPVATRRWAAARSTLVRGSALVRGSRPILVLFAVTFLVDGVAGTFGRLYPLRLPSADLVAWVTALGVLAYLAGAVALRIVQSHLDGEHALWRSFFTACAVGGAGVLGLCVAPEPFSAGVAVLLTAGALPLTRTFGTVWVNQRITGDVRATAHSLLAQADYLGTIVCGLAVAGAAQVAGLTLALVTCGALLAVAMLLMRRPW
jgi:MFS family permease